jgi:hypothetical protein
LAVAAAVLLAVAAAVLLAVAAAVLLAVVAAVLLAVVAAVLLAVVAVALLAVVAVAPLAVALLANVERWRRLHVLRVNVVGLLFFLFVLAKVELHIASYTITLDLVGRHSLLS